MCGIYGMVSLTGQPLRWPDRLVALGRDLRHRGPDAHGSYRRDTIALGVERLRIVDRRPVADQPFTTPTTALICNGEIYNDHELRPAVGSYPFRSRSDVEPLLPLLDRAGPRALRRADGMFALAHWAADSRTLTLARDPAGEKPLFYLLAEGELWFASEIRALLEHPLALRTPDPDGLEAYLALGYVPEPHTLFAGILKVPAGTALQFAGSEPPTRVEFRFDDAAPPSGLGALDRALRRSVARRCRADVPVGVFLSGGLDSSLVTALAGETAGPIPLHTFSARFADPSFDESGAARSVARTLGTAHHEVLIDDPTLLSALRRAVCGSANPLADPALLPTVALAEAAREHVGVVLSGEGADELFGGYPTYQGHLWADRLAALPVGPWDRWLRSRLGARAASGERIPTAWLLDRFLAHYREPFPARHLAWQAWGLLPLVSPARRRELTERWAPADQWSPALRGLPAAICAMELDRRTSLRDSLLVKLDRATMLFGLEARAPFLSRELTQVARGLPPTLRVSPFGGKQALRRVAARYVPARAIARRKRGLSVPIGRWVNGALGPEVDRLWSSPAIEMVQGVFPDVPIPQLLSDHRAGIHNHARPVWTVLTLLYWVDHWAMS